MHVKSQFKNLRAKLGDPCNWIEVLPSSPFEMQRDFPEQYALAFAGGALLPGTSQVDVQAVSNFDMSYGCRGAKPTASNTQAANRAESSGGFERLASVLMESMSSNNTKLMELVLAGKGNPQTQPRALAMLEARPHHDRNGSEWSPRSSSPPAAAPLIHALLEIRRLGRTRSENVARALRPPILAGRRQLRTSWMLSLHDRLTGLV
jgi:hypothetical protein